MAKNTNIVAKSSFDVKVVGEKIRSFLDAERKGVWGASVLMAWENRVEFPGIKDIPENESKSGEELAEKYGLSPATVSTRINAIRKVLELGLYDRINSGELAFIPDKLMAFVGAKKELAEAGLDFEKAYSLGTNALKKKIAELRKSAAEKKEDGEGKPSAQEEEIPDTLTLTFEDVSAEIPYAIFKAYAGKTDLLTALKGEIARIKAEAQAEAEAEQAKKDLGV